MIIELLTAFIVAQASPDELRLETLYMTLQSKRQQLLDINTEIFLGITTNGLESIDSSESNRLQEKADTLYKEIKPLQEEYETLFIKLNPERAPLFKKDKK